MDERTFSHMSGHAGSHEDQEDAARRILETLQQRDSEIHRLQKGLTHTQKQITTASKERQMALDEKEALMVQYQYCLRDLEARDILVDELRLEIKLLRERADGAAADLNVTSEHSKETILRLEQLQQENLTLAKELGTAQSVIQTKEKIEIRQAEELKHLISENKRIRKDFDGVSSELQKLDAATREHADTSKSTADVLTRRLELANDAIVKAAEEKKDLEDDLAESSQKITELTAIASEVDSLQKLTATQKRTIIELQNDVEAHVHRETAREKELDERMADISQLNAKLEEYGAANAEFEEKYRMQLEREASQEEALQKLLALNEEQRSAIDALTAENIAVKTRVDELALQLKRRDTRDSDMRSQQNEASERMCELEDRCDVQEEELTRARMHAADATAERDAMEAQIREHTAILAETQERHSRAAMAQAQQIESLTTQLAEMRERALVAETRIEQDESLASLLEGKSDELVMLSDTCRKLETERNTLDARVRQQSNEVASMLEQVASAQEAAQAHAEHIAKLEIKVDKMTTQLSAKTASCEALRTQVTNNKKRIEDLEKIETIHHQQSAKLEEAESRLRYQKSAMADAKKLTSQYDELQRNYTVRQERLDEMEKTLKTEKARHGKTLQQYQELQRRERVVKSQAEEEQAVQKKTTEELTMLRKSHRRTLDLHDEAMNRIANDIVRAILDISHRFSKTQHNMVVWKEQVSASKQRSKGLKSDLRQLRIAYDNAYQCLQQLQNHQQQQSPHHADPNDPRLHKVSSLLHSAQHDADVFDECDQLSRLVGLSNFTDLLNASVQSNTLAPAALPFVDTSALPHPRNICDSDEDDTELEMAAVALEQVGTKSASGGGGSPRSFIADERALGQRVMTALGAVGPKGAKTHGDTLYKVLSDAFQLWMVDNS